MSAQEFEVDGIYYNITSWEDKTVEVKSGRPKSSGVVTIPQYVVNYNNGDTYRVTSIGDKAFRDCDGLTSVVIPESVTSIENETFANCKNMTSLYICSEIKSIRGNAFYECFNLVDILIGAEKVIKIVKEVFSQDTYNKATLYVPYISVADYKATYPWNLFNIIGKEFTDINNVLMNKKGTGGSTVRKGS